MKVFYSELHRRHNPPFELSDGGERVPYLENPERMDKILSALRKTGWAEITEPVDFGLGPILAVHDAEYISFLASAWDEWLTPAADKGTSSGKVGLLPATFALRRNPHKPTSLLGRAGYYIMDLSAVIVEGTYQAARSSANCALSGAKWIADLSAKTSPSTRSIPGGFRPLSPSRPSRRKRLRGRLLLFQQRSRGCKLAFLPRQSGCPRYRLSRWQRNPGYLL